LRELVALIEKRQRKPIYTDFDDEMGDESEVALPGFTAGTDYAKFRAKAQAFLRAHQDHVAIHKLRMNRPLTVADLGELERMLLESGVGAAGYRTRRQSSRKGWGSSCARCSAWTVRPPRQALAGFLNGKTLAANQIEFVNLIVNHLTEHGVLDAALLYESPFIDITPRGPEALFDDLQIEGLLSILAEIKARALAA
jgi:type I restriction enzyme R subunit